MNPNFANSTCNPLTCVALKAVAAPNLFASLVNAPTWSFVLPKTAAKFAFPCSKSLAIVIAFPKALTRPATPAVIPNAPAKFFKAPTALDNPFG